MSGDGSVLGPGLGSDADAPDPTDVEDMLAKLNARADASDARADAATAATEAYADRIAALERLWAEVKPLIARAGIAAGVSPSVLGSTADIRGLERLAAGPPVVGGTIGTGVDAAVPPADVPSESEGGGG